jgi:hypothetical protein
VEFANNCSSISLAEGDPGMPEPSLRRGKSFGCVLAVLPLSAVLDFLMASNTLPIVTSSAITLKAFSNFSPGLLQPWGNAFSNRFQL